MVNTFDQMLDFLKAAFSRDLEGMKSIVQSSESSVSRIEALSDEMTVKARKGSISGRVDAIAALEDFTIGRSLAIVGLNNAREAEKLLQPKGQAVATPELGSSLATSTPSSLDLAEPQSAPSERRYLRRAPGRREGRQDLSNHPAPNPTLTAQLAADLIRATTYFALAQAAAESARNLADFGEEQGPVTDAGKLDLESMARAYAAAGTGAFANFNSLVVDQLAQATKDIQRAKDLISFRDPFYPLVTIAATYSESLNTAKNIDPADRVSLQLGAGVFSYLYTAYLLDKWYGLDADWSQLLKNNVLTFRNERALSFQLDSAKQNTLIAAAECKTKLGFVPDFVAYQFQLGNARREGDENAKLLALLNYWHATFYARLALQFGRS